MEDGVRSGAHRGVRRGERGSGSRSVSVSARGSATDGGERIEIEVRRRPSCLVGVGVESSGGGEGGEWLQTEEEKCIKRLADGVDDEPNLPELLGIDHIAPIKDECRLLHVVKDLLVVQGLELVPLGEDADTMGPLGGLICIPHHAHLLECGGAGRLQVHWVVPVELAHGEVPLDLVLGDLWVVDADLCLVTQQTVAHINGWCLPGVTGVLLERKAKDGNLLAGDCVEHGGHNAVSSLACSKTTGLGGGVDRYKDDVCLGDMLLHISAEEEVPASALLHDLIEARLVDRELFAVPGINARLGNVNNHHLDCWAFEGNDGHGWAADIASSNAADLHHLLSLVLKL
uniref:Uncharacterized protein n=1 Tax=Oryza glumipatula TaxID=40148 RepID=A0A0E0BS67_9ORYZ